MVEKEVVVNIDQGLKSRYVSLLVKKAISFQSKIYITYNGKKADAKSLINVMALKVPKGARTIISASGCDEILAVEELVAIASSLH